MTKKLLSFWLILSAIFGSTSYAFASETSSETTDSMSATAVERNFEETAELNEISGSPEVVYNVSVEWGDLKFKYSFYGDYWNSKTHKYEGGTVGWKGTTDSSGIIKITNTSVSCSDDLFSDLVVLSWRDFLALFIMYLTITTTTGIISRVKNQR